MNQFRPQENLLLSTPIGLKSLGAEFMVEAPFSACRLCGAIYQSKLDRLCYAFREEMPPRLIEVFDPFTQTSSFTGDVFALNTLNEADERRARWRRLHERRYHTEDEMNALQRSGFALTPEAANKLAPYGITPLGNLHEDIASALFEAPRTPLNDAEG